MVKTDNSGKAVFAHVTIGLQLAITMIIFVYGGHRVDLYFVTSPLFLIIGTILGMVLGFYHLFKELQSDDDTKGAAGNDKKREEKRIKWN